MVTSHPPSKSQVKSLINGDGVDFFLISNSAYQVMMLVMIRQNRSTTMIFVLPATVTEICPVSQTPTLVGTDSFWLSPRSSSKLGASDSYWKPSVNPFAFECVSMVFFTQLLILNVTAIVLTGELALSVFLLPPKLHNLAMQRYFPQRFPAPLKYSCRNCADHVHRMLSYVYLTLMSLCLI